MIGGSIGGLASGMDTAAIIGQLMQLEAVPQGRLKVQISGHQSAMTKLQELNTKLAALATKAADLARSDGWSPLTATSSYDKATVTTTSGAKPTTLGFTVLGTAKAHTVSFGTSANLTDVVVTHASRNIKIDMLDGTVQTLNTGDGTLKGVVDAINTANLGLRANTVQLDDGTYRLRVEATATGADGNFTITQAQGNQQLLGGVTVVTQGADAQIKVGADTLSSASNTFDDVLPGVNITLAVDAVAGTATTLTLATDAKAMTDSAKGLVDALNAILSDIDAATRTASGTTKAGVLAGDSRLRGLRDQLVNTLYSSAGTGLSTVGIQLDKQGKFVLDEAKFKTAYQTDPGKTAAHFVAAASNTGFADRLATVAKQASRPVDGTISAAVTGRKSLIDQLQSGVTAWDRRLELRRTTLTRQFTALETALGRMNSQSSWLAGQLASLPTSSGI